MRFPSQQSHSRWHHLVWWLFIITMPWMNMANNISLILLTISWLVEGNFVIKWRRLTSSPWVWPFIVYYFLLLIGLLYTLDIDNGFFTIDKKVSFFIVPLIASTSPPLDEKFVGCLKRSFVYSCFAIILLCFVSGVYNSYIGSPSTNFDIDTNQEYSIIHPSASPIWMHFSYIQLTNWVGIHPGYLSMYLAFSLVILLTENFDGRMRKALHLAIGFLVVSFLALLASRMAIGAFICSALYLGIRKIRLSPLTSTWPEVSLLCVLLFFLWLNPVAKFRVIEEPSNTIYQANPAVTRWNSVSYRLLEWEGGWSVVRANWLTGVGTGGAKMAMDNFYSHYNSGTIGLELNAHNQYLQTWIESGILGLLAFLMCLWAGLFRLYMDSSYVCFILIFSLMCLTESVGERQKGIVFFVVFQTLFLGLERKTQ